jgi:hypothetical protein
MLKELYYKAKGANVFIKAQLRGDSIAFRGSVTLSQGMRCVEDSSVLIQGAVLRRRLCAVVPMPQTKWLTVMAHVSSSRARPFIREFSLMPLIVV